MCSVLTVSQSRDVKEGRISSCILRIEEELRGHDVVRLAQSFSFCISVSKKLGFLCNRVGSHRSRHQVAARQ